MARRALGATLSSSLQPHETPQHCDHGKTNLVDVLFRRSGTFRDNQRGAERTLVSNDIERERGITPSLPNARRSPGTARRSPSSTLRATPISATRSSGFSAWATVFSCSPRRRPSACVRSSSSTRSTNRTSVPWRSRRRCSTSSRLLTQATSNSISQLSLPRQSRAGPPRFRTGPLKTWMPSSNSSGNTCRRR